MLTLFEHIRTDWRVWEREEEMKIIHQYAERGRKMTILYAGNHYWSTNSRQKVDLSNAGLPMLRAVMVLTTNLLFTIPPIVAKVIDITLRNDSEIGEFSIPVYYYNVNMKRYYFHISMHCFVCVSVGALVTVAIDSRLIIFVQHGCGLFAAVGYVNIIDPSKFVVTGCGAVPVNFLSTRYSIETCSDLEASHFNNWLVIIEGRRRLINGFACYITFLFNWVE